MAAQNVLAPVLSSSFPGVWNYDVFLSFRGPDTRHSFTDHLRDALLREGITVFRDDDELTRGTEIKLVLHQAIVSSRISIIVFSRNYATSKWCLDELVTIIGSSKTLGNRVIPIFYGVDPTEVRRQIGSYGEALVTLGAHADTINERHQVKVQAWRDALTDASYLSGRHLQDSYETKLISEIVKDVLLVVCPKKLHVADHPVGMESRMDDINSFHGSGSDDVRIIGIYGMGGIGKTNLAKSLYNLQVQSFTYSCFLANVREESEQHMGLVRLQTQLLSSIHMKTENLIGSVDFGKNLIKERCRSKKILLVIDDVDRLDQIKSFVGERNWFGSGSRIIIMTRDEHLLRQVVVDETYQAKELGKNESMDLFSWHAFKTLIPPANYVEISRDVIDYAGGLPLALEVLGSYLYGRSIEEWKSAIAKLKKIPHGQIQDTLRISYDTLEDDGVKEIFLHIACFLIGMDKHYIVDILNGCGFNTEIGISILENRSLLTVDAKNELRMHDLLRDMGREIVRKECPKEPGKRSRLWSREDACDVLKKLKGTDSVEGIAIIQPSNDKLHLNVKAFASMRNLRLLQMENVSLTGSYDHLSKELRWIYWPFYGLKYLPPNICLENLVTLDMQHSEVHLLWKGSKRLENLKTINLSHSKFLKETPDLSGLPKLETLSLEGCQSLCVVHESVGYLQMLAYLNLKDCSNLYHLPSNVYDLKSLQRLNIRGCSLHLVREVTKASVFIDRVKSCFGACGQGSQPGLALQPNHSLVTLDPPSCPPAPRFFTPDELDEICFDSVLT